MLERHASRRWLVAQEESEKVIQIYGMKIRFEKERDTAMQLTVLSTQLRLRGLPRTKSERR